MNPERWQQIERIYHDALAIDVSRRAAFLSTACGEDAALRAEVESLFVHDDATGQLIASAPIRPSLIGQRLFGYDVVSLLGAGGMGEVYRARDPRLGRDVAIKVLPAAFSAEPERLQRFEQEARAAAALNHPNILAVYDVGTLGEAPYIVSELLEGETLRARLIGGSLPLRKVVDYSVQIVRGLAAAHEKGIVHRDLKPENIFVTADGRVKILDFGLAKLTQPEGAGAGASALPTTPPDTVAGVVLGTVGYMAPEQVRGQQADHRSDVFAFGAVLYEMLSGQRAFRGATTADTMSAILKEDPPDLPAVDRHIPPALERVVDRCLEKSPSARFQSTHDLTFALEGLSSQSAAIAVPDTQVRARRFDRFAWPVAGLLGLTAVGLAFFPVRRPSGPELTAVRFELHPPPGTRFSFGAANPSQAVSPDGRRLAFVAQRFGSPSSLWVRELDSVEAHMLPGTDGATDPFWSPDGGFLGFFAGRQLKRIDITGGSPQVICEAGTAGGGTWNVDDVIIYGTDAGPLFRVPATGGQPVALTTLDSSQKETVHRRPQFLPDGSHFLYIARPSNTVFVGELDSAHSKPLLTADSKAMYTAPGYLLFVRQGTLMAQMFDANSLETTGQAFPVAAQVGFNPAVARAAFSVSDAGVLTTAGVNVGAARFAWFDRTGKSLEMPIPEVGPYTNFDLSPDERQIAVQRAGDIWLLDVVRGVLSRLTSDPATEGDPIWSPDSRRLVFTSFRNGQTDLFEKTIAGGAETLLLASDEPKYPEDWSSDGRSIVYISPQGGRRFWVLPMVDDGKPSVLIDTPFVKDEPHFSPDGQWLAYYSDESGRAEVYVQPFPGPGERVRVSTDGGSQPRWKKDGSELFYLSLDGKMMAATIKYGRTLQVDVPKILFQTPITVATPNIDQYDVTADGQRFVVLAPVEGDTQSPITVVLNWTAGLKN